MSRSVPWGWLLACKYP